MKKMIRLNQTFIMQGGMMIPLKRTPYTCRVKLRPKEVEERGKEILKEFLKKELENAKVEKS